MKDKKLNLWIDFLTEFGHYFESCEDIWLKNLDSVKKFITVNQKVPNSCVKDKSEAKLSRWIQTQRDNFKNNSRRLSSEHYRKIWLDFLDEFDEFMKSKETIWLEKLKNLKNFLQENDRLPSEEAKETNEKKLGRWVSDQRSYYKNYLENGKKFDYAEHWKTFIQENSIFFKSLEQLWDEKLDKLKNFIDNNGRIPLTNSLDENERKLAGWLSSQKILYKKIEDGMKCEERYNKWNKFIEDYKDFMENDDDTWLKTFDELKNFIITNNKVPYEKSGTEEEKKLGRWFSNQKKNYKNQADGMKKIVRYKIWEQFLIQFDSYIKNPEKEWENNFEDTKNFIIQFERLPTELNRDLPTEKKLCKWLSHQIENNKNNAKSMLDENKKIVFNKFLDDFEQYFRSNEKKWDINFKNLQTFITENNRLPKKNSNEELFLFNWLRTQKSNYTYKTKILKDNERYGLFENFLNENKKFF